MKICKLLYCSSNIFVFITFSTKCFRLLIQEISNKYNEISLKKKYYLQMMYSKHYQNIFELTEKFANGKKQISIYL